VLPAEVNIATARNPFAGTRIDSSLPVGMTLREMVAAQGLRESAAYGVQVVLNGDVVPDRMLSHIKPKAGTQVIVRVVPHGGDAGKVILTIVISILIIVAAVFSGGAALTAFAAGTGGFGAVAGSGAALLGGLAGLATGIQSLAAPPPDIYVGAVPETQDSAALQGTKNSVRLYKPIRTVLGRYRVYPDLIGKPFVERVGKDAVVRLLMCFGYGPLDIEDIKIGETPIGDIPGIRYNVLQGWDDDSGLTIFRDEVDQDASFQPDFPEEDPEVAILTSQLGPEELSFDIQFSSGLIAFSDTTGTPTDVTVRFTVEERELGDASWTYIGTPTMGLSEDTSITQVSSGTFDIRMRERGLVTRGLRWTVPAGSTADVAHQVRVTRISTETRGDTSVADARITVIRTIRPHIKTTIPNLSKIELEINANDTGLSGIIDNLSAICTSIAPVFDAGTQSWGPATSAASAYNVTMFPTRNAAWLFAQVLRGPANSRPVADSRIDGPGIANWAGNLAGTGLQPISGDYTLPRNIDAIVDFTTTTRKLLADIAGGGRAALNIVDGKYSAVQDIPRDAVIQHFSPRNSSGFGGAKAFKRSPHALRVAFVNPDKGYQKDERIVYDDGYSESGNIGAIWDFGSSLTTSPAYGGSATWTGASGVAVTANGHAMRIENNGGSSAYFYNGTGSVAGTSFLGTDNPIVRIRVRKIRSSSSIWRGWMFWSNDTSWDGSSYPFASDDGRSLSWDEPDWKDGSWITLDFDMSSYSTWTGENIRHLRWDFSHSGPATDNDIFEIDWIRVDDNTQPAIEFMDLSLWGVADADQAWRDARYHIASHRLRPEVFTIQADVEHIACNRGDLVRVSHDVIGVGYGGARIKAVNNSGGAFVSATMDEEFHFDQSASYAARLRADDGSDLLVNIVNQSGTSDQLVAVTATSYGASAAPAVGDHLLFGERDTESLLCIVQRVSPRNDLTAVLELIEYNAAVYEHGTIPQYTSTITLQNSPNLLEPVTPEIVGEPISDETAASYMAAGSPEPQILVNVVTPQNAEGTFAPTTHFHAQFRLKVDGAAASGWLNVPRIESDGDTRIIVRPVDEGSVYDIRVRAISDPAASASVWVYINNHTVVGLSTPPPAPTDLSVWGDAIRWDYGTPPNDFAGFIVKHQAGSDATWATGIPLSENLITDNWVSIGGRIQPGTTTIMVRAVDLSGNESASLISTRTIRSPEDRSITHESTWTNVWAGTKTNCTHDVTSTYLEADVGSTALFYPGGSSATFWSGTGSSDFWGLILYEEMTYVQNVSILGYDGVAWPTSQPLPGRQRFKALDIEGSNFNVEYAPVLTITVDPSSGFVSYGYDTFRPWPGVRELQEIEFVFPGSVLEYELIAFRITIAGGTTQGKMKAAHYVVEGLPKTHRETLTITTSGTTVDLTGDLWRKITNVTVTPNNTANTAQGALFGEAYDLDAAQITTSPYELTGPTVRLYDATGADATGTATVVIEGY
jgi:predicted phage tail protein